MSFAASTTCSATSAIISKLRRVDGPEIPTAASTTPFPEIDGIAPRADRRQLALESLEAIDGLRREDGKVPLDPFDDMRGLKRKNRLRTLPFEGDVI
ncbi:hypothetical protein LJR009_004673 [Bosea sp. LjRoot9]